ncbi:MAG TPA: cyclic nucleotide-binding domain-containing protein, partial [Terrimicrobiaceae bacterium]
MEKLPRKILGDDKLLAKFTVFAELSQEELHTLIEQSSTESYPAGELIIHAGEEGHCMYVILQGSVLVSVKKGNGEIELAKLSAGDFFGEVALVDDGPRSANVTAIEACELLCITRTTLGVLAGLQPAAAIHLLAAIGRSLVARLRRGNK